ncbi:hypothetical protein V8E53_012866 [Lactarius tabidus]|jgi:hypothetical protein
MKFATTSSLVLLACSLFQLAYSVPVPAPYPDAPLKRAEAETDALTVDYKENLIF